MRKKICLTAVVTVLMLTGCESNVPDLSHVNNDIAAQYVADALLRHDKHYDEGLDYDHSLLKPTPTPAPTPATASTENNQNSNNSSSGSGGNSSSGTNGASVSGNDQSASRKSVSVGEVYGVKDVTITPVSYQLKNSYGSSVYQIMPQKKGNKLVVVYFNISNKSGKKKRVNLTKQEISAELIVNGKTVGNPMHSFMDNDLQNLNATIAAGKKKQGILLFEISKKTKVSSVEIHLMTDTKEASSTVK